MKIYMYVVMFTSAASFMPAANYYVAPWGSNGFSGLSWDSAFATLQHAADIVTVGDSVFTADGEYVGFDLRSGGTQTMPVVFMAAGDSARILTENGVTPDGINVENADWVVIDGFIVNGIARAGIRVAVSEHVVVKNNVCSYNDRWGIFTGFADYAVIENNLCMYSQDEHGIYFSNSADHPIIRNNISHHNSGCGIHMNGDESMGGDGLITDAIVACNIIYENGDSGGSGINCDGVAESYIYNNLLYMNHASGISLYRIDASEGSYNTRVYNNTIINASDGRWCLNINTASYADTVYNNIFINLHTWRGSISIDPSSTPDFCSDYNIIVNRLSNDGGNSTMTFAQWQALGYDLHSMLADPLDSIFIDWINGDYHLRNNSQTIDAGTDLVNTIVQYDLDSIPRPQGAEYDIGAYEKYIAGIDENKRVRSGYKYAIETCADRIIFSHLRGNESILIFDVSGRVVKAVRHRTHGETYSWNVNTVPSGIYFYAIILCNKIIKTGKIILVK
jgi:parallel beta-helix repeat protein